MRTPASGKPAHNLTPEDTAALYQALRSDFERLASGIYAIRKAMQNDDDSIAIDLATVLESYACSVIVDHNEQSGVQS